MSTNFALTTHSRGPNECSIAWSSLTIPSYELVSGLSGQVRITDASPISTFGQIALGSDKFADGSGNVEITSTNNKNLSLPVGDHRE